MLAFEKLSPDLSYGAVIRGITLKDLESEDNRQQLRDLWYQHGLLIFRDLNISSELHVELSRVFGKLEGHFQKDRLVPGHPELVAFSADQEKSRPSKSMEKCSSDTSPGTQISAGWRIPIMAASSAFIRCRRKGG